MATPKCPMCNNHTFSFEKLTLDKCKYQFYGICCSSCGCVVGTHEYYNIGTLLYRLAKKLNIDLSKE